MARWAVPGRVHGSAEKNNALASHHESFRHGNASRRAAHTVARHGKPNLPIRSRDVPFESLTVR